MMHGLTDLKTLLTCLEFKSLNLFALFGGIFLPFVSLHSSFDVSLIVHLSITLANDQLNAHIFLIHLLQSSTCTCFEQYLAHPQEVKLY